MQEFFTRKVKKRPIKYNLNKVLSPCDAKVLSISEITEDKTFLIKGRNYSLGEFYTGIK